MPRKAIEWPPKNLPRDFPLTIHRRGYVKKGLGWICGKLTPDEALEIYHDKAKAKLRTDQDGTAPKPVVLTRGDKQTVDQLAERFVGVKRIDAEDGSIEWDHFIKVSNAIAEFTCHVIAKDHPELAGVRIGAVAVEDLTPDHFSDFARAAVKAGGVKYARRLARLIMSLFNYADGEDWIDHPVKFGKRFRKAANATGEPIRKHVPTPDVIRQVLAHLDAKIIKLKAGFARDLLPVQRLKAAVLLAVNGGYGATDLSDLPLSVVDLDNAIIDYRRGKTMIVRVVPLMPETVEALRPVVAAAAKDGQEFLMRTREGKPLVWQKVKHDESGEILSVTWIDSLNNAYSKVLTELGAKKKGSGFYKIKDLHVTEADNYGDDRAARMLTGHVEMAKRRDGRASYGTVSDQRLRALVEHIRHAVLVPGDAPSAPLPAAGKRRVGRKP